MSPAFSCLILLQGSGLPFSLTEFSYQAPQHIFPCLSIPDQAFASVFPMAVRRDHQDPRYRRDPLSLLPALTAGHKDLDLKLFATSKPSTRSARDAKVVTLSLPDPEDSRWPSAHRRTTPQTFPGRRVIVLQQRAGNENSPPRRGVVLCPGVRFIQLVGFALQPAEARKARSGSEAVRKACGGWPLEETMEMAFNASHRADVVLEGRLPRENLLRTTRPPTGEISWLPSPISILGHIIVKCPSAVALQNPATSIETNLEECRASPEGRAPE
ncbi:hypothetical protein JHW43_009135 [Diplocarpon mali]|nr:hypothetical protein JHW43_009135 [Diplocarpon mali]